MPRLPAISAGELIKVLQQEGFEIVRRKGSHIVLQKKTPEGKATTVVPNHEELAPGTLRSILKQSGIAVQDLLKLLTLLIGVTPRLW